MSAIASTRLLDSMVDFTAEFDRDHFRKSLSSTVRELMGIDQVVFYRPLRRPRNEIRLEPVFCEPGRPRLGARLANEPDDGGLINAERLAKMIRDGQELVVSPGATTLMLPVVVRESPIEILFVRAVEISADALTMLKAFTRLYRNFISLVAEGERDPLTGLLNRRVLETRLDQFAAQCDAAPSNSRAPATDSRKGVGPDGLSLFIAVIDVDRFKRVNDTFGHLFGDEVILLVAQMMREVFRDEDMMFRYGGEEFVVLIAAPGIDDAMAAVERLRRRIGARSFPQIGQITVSAGIAEICRSELPNAAIARADRALYHAKDTGRNRVCEFGALLRTGQLAQPLVNTHLELF